MTSTASIVSAGEILIQDSLGRVRTLLAKYVGNGRVEPERSVGSQPKDAQRAKQGKSTTMAWKMPFGLRLSARRTGCFSVVQQFVCKLPTSPTHTIVPLKLDFAAEKGGMAVSAVIIRVYFLANPPHRNQRSRPQHTGETRCAPLLKSKSKRLLVSFLPLFLGDTGSQAVDALNRDCCPSISQSGRLGVS
jgi:hypothetical protein